MSDKVRKSVVEGATPSLPSQIEQAIAPHRSHVKRSIQLLGQLQDLHLEPALHVVEDAPVGSSLLALLLVGLDEVDGQALGPEPAGPAHPVEVGVPVDGEVCIAR